MRATTIICAWCGDKVHDGDPGLPVSHGLCSRCEAEMGEPEACAGCGRGDTDFTDNEGVGWHRRCHRRAHIGPRIPAG